MRLQIVVAHPLHSAYMIEVEVSSKLQDTNDFRCCFHIQQELSETLLYHPDVPGEPGYVDEVVPLRTMSIPRDLL